MYAHSLDGVVRNIEDFNRIAGKFQTRSRIGNVFEIIHNQAIQRFCAIGWKLPVHDAIERSNICRAIDQVTIVFLPYNIGVIVGGISRKLADYFFQNVFQRNQTLDVTILVHY